MKTLFKPTYWPIYANLFVIAWTMMVSPYTKYGDLWAMLPVFVSFLIAVLVHLYLVWKAKRRFKMLAYGFLHMLLFSYILLSSLMLISKDAL